MQFHPFGKHPKRSLALPNYVGLRFRPFNASQSYAVLPIATSMLLWQALVRQNQNALFGVSDKIDAAFIFARVGLRKRASKQTGVVGGGQLNQ